MKDTKMCARTATCVLSRVEPGYGEMFFTMLQTYHGEDGIQNDFFVDHPDRLIVEAIRNFWLTGGAPMVHAIMTSCRDAIAMDEAPPQQE